MSDQQRKELLSQVEKGEITVDEALKRLEEADRVERTQERADDLAQVRTALSDVMQEVSDSLKDASSVVNDVFTEVGKDLRDNKDLGNALAGLFSGLFSLGGGHTFEYLHEGSFDGNDAKVVLRGKNGKLHVRSWEEKGYKLVARVNVRAASEADAKALSKEAYEFTADGHNLEMEVRSGLRQGGVSAELFLPAQLDYNLVLDTSNGSVRVEDIAGTELQVDTSNGAVVLNGCSFDSALVETSNGSVTLTGNCGDLKVDTSNGSIRVDAAGAGNSKLDLATSNGSITLALNDEPDTGYSIEASTSNGRVTADLVGLSVVTKGKNRLDAKSDNYDSCSKHTRIFARTSNGRINISHRH